MMLYRDKGFTLIELLVMVSLVAIILAIGVPSFGALASQSRIDTAKHQLISALSEARSEAIQSGSQVIICRRADQEQVCAGNAVAEQNADWSQGWLIFRDQDNDMSLDPGELLRVHALTGGEASIAYSRGDALVFDGMGLLVTNIAGQGTFAFTDSANNSMGAGVLIQPTGRIRMCGNWQVEKEQCADN